MLSIKNSLCGMLMLATYATAQSQSAINLKVELCSKQNTGASSDPETNIYQTLGLCNDKCQGKFAYAVLQYQDCWCANEKPAETVSVESCNQACPGYPDQKCGNKGGDLFAYVALDGAPVSSGNDTTSTTSSSGSASSSSSSTSNSTMPATTHSSSSGTNSSSSAGGASGNSNSSSENATEASTGAANSLPVPYNTLAMSAIFGLVMSCAFGFAA